MGRSFEHECTVREPLDEAWASLGGRAGDRFVGQGLLDGVQGDLVEHPGRRVVELDLGGTLEIELLDAFGDTRLTVRGRGLGHGLAARLRGQTLGPRRRRSAWAVLIATVTLALGTAAVGNLLATARRDGPVVLPKPATGEVSRVLAVPHRLRVPDSVSRLAVSEDGWLAVEQPSGPPWLVDLDTLEAAPVDVSSGRVAWLPDGRLLVQRPGRTDVLEGGYLRPLAGVADATFAVPMGADWLVSTGTELELRSGASRETLVSWADLVRPVGFSGDRLWFEGWWAGRSRVAWRDAGGEVGAPPADGRQRIRPVLASGGAVWFEQAEEGWNLAHSDGRRVTGVVLPPVAPPAVRGGDVVAWSTGDRIGIWHLDTNETTFLDPGVEGIDSVAMGSVRGRVVLAFTSHESTLVWAPVP